MRDDGERTTMTRIVRWGISGGSVVVLVDRREMGPCTAGSSLKAVRGEI
jgi:hypothetical protein